MEEKNKKRIPLFNVPIVFLLVILIVLLAYNAFLINNKNNDENKIEQTEQNEEVNNEDSENDLGEELSVTDNRVTNSLAPFKLMEMYFSDVYFGYFYKNDINEISNIPDDVKIAIAIYSMKDELDEQVSNLSNTYSEYLPSITISGQKVSEAMNNIYGDITYNNVSLKGKGCAYDAFSYNSNTNEYTQTVPACGGALLPYYQTKVTKATLFNDKLEIELLVGFFKFEENNGITNIVLYPNDNSNVKIETFTDTNTIDLSNYQEQLNTYKYTFIKDEDNTFNFVSANIVK